MPRRSIAQIQQAIRQRALARRVSHEVPNLGPAPADLPTRRPRLLDEVELLEPVGTWPAGATGDVVHVNGNDLLVEISDENGQCLDLFWSRPELLRPILP